MTAHFGNKIIEFSLPDWSRTTSTVWSFEQSHHDLLMDISSCELDQKSCIIYRIHKYDCYTKEIDSNYAFAVQPLTQRLNNRDTSGKVYLIQGQYQLPLYQGEIPQSLLDSTYHSVESVLKNSMQGGQISLLNY